MKIAVIGAGNIGATVGGKLAGAGHQVDYGVRDPAKRKGAAVSIPDALAGADAVLLAVPGAAVVEFATTHSRALDGKIVIDATNNFRGATFNAWQELKNVLPAAKLYRAFNSLGWEVFVNPVLGGSQADLFFAGPDGSGRSVVESLIKDVGLRPIWVGGEEHAATVDGVLVLWAALSRIKGRRIAINLISD